VLSLVRQLLEYDAVETRIQADDSITSSSKNCDRYKKIVGEKYFRALKREKMKKRLQT